MWQPPESLEEKLKRVLVPGWLYIRYLHAKEVRRGEAEIGLVGFLADRRRLSLDIGANKGVYSYALLPHSRAVHAFEPNPKAFRVLEGWGRNLLTLHPLALGDRSGRAELAIPKGRRGYSNQGGSLSELKREGDHRSVEVPVLRLDDLALANVGFIKIGVEGFELQVLAGAAETIAKCKPNMLIEIEEKHTKQELSTMVGEICGYGYDCFCVVNGALSPFGRFDPERHHRAPASPDEYVFNFIFLPRSV